jgi:membrane-associated phospholipid phosphatase
MPNRARKALFGAAIGVCLLALTWYAAFHIGFVKRADHNILWGFAGLQRQGLDSVTRFTAGLCDPQPYVFLAAVPILVALVRRRPRVAVTVGLIMLAANVTSQLLKPLLALPREFPGPPSFSASGSWPSGHATAALALALCGVIAASPRWRPAVGAVMAAFVVAVCYSFLELGWHYPSDVLGGFLVATIWTLLGAATLWWIDARRPVRRRELSPSGGAQISIGEALAPMAALLLGALFLAGVVALARPHAVIAYASAHKTFIAGAAMIGALVMTLATAATLALRRG